MLIRFAVQIKYFYFYFYDEEMRSEQNYVQLIRDMSNANANYEINEHNFVELFVKHKANNKNNDSDHNIKQI